MQKNILKAALVGLALTATVPAEAKAPPPGAVAVALQLSAFSGRTFFSDLDSLKSFHDALVRFSAADLLSYFKASSTVSGSDNNTSYTWTSVISFTTGGSGPSYSITDYLTNPATGAVAAVPGPLAGAGLPAVLGLVGFAAYLRRRSQAVAA